MRTFIALVILTLLAHYKILETVSDIGQIALVFTFIMALMQDIKELKNESK